MQNWIEKQRHLVDFTLASLARRKGKNLGLLAVYAAIVFSLASVLLFSHSVRREAALLLADSPEVLVQRMVAGRHDLMPAAAVDKLKGLRGVQTVEARLWGYYFDPVAAANYTFMVPTRDAPPPGRIKVGPGIAATRGAGAGDVLAFRAYDGTLFSFAVAGTLDSESALVSADLVLVSEADFRTFFGVAPGLYTDVAVSVRNAREVRTVAEKIAKALPDSRPILREEVLRTYDSLFDWREGMMLVLLAGATLAFVIFAWDKASGLSAEERREIGILKAVGWETSDVIRMKMWEGALLSLAAFLLGYAAAYLHVFYFGAGVLEPVLKGWAVLYPAFRPTPFVDGLQVFTLFLLTVFPYTVATIVPVWRAAIVDPDLVMRS
ncbi:MAG: FtsX-like permease family protein [Magnetospirillum sp. WYHS-4]